MKIIPVIDLKAGNVVHARRGERDSYRPIVSGLCAGSRPRDIVEALLGVHPFDTLYIADLDAIAGRGDSGEIIAALHREFPGLQLWVDGGLGDAASGLAWLARGLGTLVLGSEALRDARSLPALAAEAPRDGLVLSLDFRGERFLGPPALLAEAGAWPARVIVMTLGRVGSDAGPDLARIDECRHRAADREIFAAGGVRGGEDLLELRARGVSGVLVASALHDRRIGRDEIAAVAADASAA